MRLFEDLKTKCACYYGDVAPKNLLRVVFTDGTSAVIAYRLSQAMRARGLSALGALVSRLNQLTNGCLIGRHAEFEGGFVLMHPHGVVINGGVKGGRNVVIESGVVVGAARNGLPVEVPQLGDDVFIGAGAKVLGGVRVGNNVRIGANAVVVKDVPDDVTVVGVPARVIKSEAAVSGRRCA